MSEDRRYPENADSTTQSQYYRRLFDYAGVVVIGADCQGLIVSWNRAATNLFHADSSAMLGRPIVEVMPGQHRDKMQLAVQEAADTGAPSEFEIDLDQAKYSIDLLQILKDKTKGNLEEDEGKHLNGILYELRMRYVSVSRGGA